MSGLILIATVVPKWKRETKSIINIHTLFQNNVARFFCHDLIIKKIFFNDFIKTDKSLDTIQYKLHKHK